MRVRYQLAFTLGALSGSGRNAPLARILKRDGADRWVRLAALSSLPDGASDVLADLAGDAKFRTSAAARTVLVELAGQVIRGIHLGNVAFQSKWSKLDSKVQDEAALTISGLLFKDFTELPAKLHFHKLKDKQVTSHLDPKKKVGAWSLHITADDRNKASFTFEDGQLYFRTCGKHDAVDKSP